MRDEVQQVAPRVWDLLVYLLANRSRVVPKQELIDKVWDGALLTDSALAQGVRKARKAIGNAADETGMIRTVHRIGYLFAGDVESVEHEGADTNPPDDDAAATPSLAEAPDRPGPSTPPAPRPHRDAAQPRGDLPGLGFASQPEPRGEVVADNASLRVHASDQEVAAWQALRGSTEGKSRLDLLLALAWHLRERDTAAAMEAASEAERCLSRASTSEGASTGRIALVRAYAAWLAGETRRAEGLAAYARADFERAACAIGLCDTCLLMVAIAIDQDDASARTEWLNRGAPIAVACGDPDRAALMRLHTALAEAQVHPGNARAKWSLLVDHWLETCGAGVRAACHYVKAIWASDSGDYLTTLRHNLAARQLNAEAGQRRFAIRDAANVGAMFANVYDNDAALDWLQSALEQARRTGWPFILGNCLAQMGGLLSNMLDRFDEAAALLAEANALLEAFPGSRAALQALRYQADVELARGEPARALGMYERLAALARDKRLVAYEMEADYSRARALLALGRPVASRDLALATAERAKRDGNHYYLYLLMHHLARLHGMAAVQPEAGVEPQGAVIHYLMKAFEFQALDVPEGATPELLQDIADEHARRGDHAAAYDYCIRSAQARSKAQSTELKSRAIAMNIRHDTERAHVEAERQRTLAAAQQARADLLARTNEALARLALVGHDVTRQRDMQAMFATLETHMQGVLHQAQLEMFLLDTSERFLRRHYGASSDAMADDNVAMDDPVSPVARCARERHDFELEQPGAGAQGQQVMHVCLLVGTRLIGVMVIRCALMNADEQTERLVARSLAALAAMSLDNAIAYRRLESANDALELANAAQVAYGRRQQRREQDRQ